jgi:glycosyltransferase involved in cell wall biosynthesis
MKIMFLIRSLEFGGAERQLVNLAQGLRKSGHDVVVVTLYSGESLEKELFNAGIVVQTLGKRGRWDILKSALKLIRLVKEFRPDILHGYLSTANLLGLLPKLIFPSLKLVWGVRASNVDFSYYDWFTKFCFRCECILSKAPDLIIANSYAGREHHVQHGFPRTKLIVIHNGIDTERFSPDEKAGKKVRSEWGIEDRHTLIGVVGRLDPMKDHPTFLKAAAMVVEGKSDIRLVCIGDGPSDYRDKLQSLANKLGLGSRLIWGGLRQDMSSVYNALDLAVSSSSWGEGLPNAVVEAMACGVPCVVTSVGDSALLVDEPELVVKSSDPALLAQGINTALTSAYRKGSCLRERIVKDFSMANCVEQTQRTLGALL